MSKRSAQWQGGEERYGGPAQPEEMSDRPQQATAAQLAKRKIAQAKGSRRPRSESPLTSTGFIFDQANQSNNTMPNPSNPFGATPGFTFGGGNTNGSTQSFGAGGGSFTFGGQSGQQTQQSTPNPNSSFTFGAAPTTTSFQFGQTPSSQATNGVSNGFSFGQNSDSTPKPATSNVFGDQTPKPSNPFGGSSNPSTGIFGANGTNGFTFGQKSAEPQNTTNSFGQNATGSQNTTSTFGGFNSTQASEKPAATDGWSSFTSKPAETPKPNTSFTPASNSIFAQANGSTNGVFAGFGQGQKTPNVKFTAQNEDNDASMMSPENTPQKPSTSIFGALNGTVKDPAPSATPADKQTGKGPSLFDRISGGPHKETNIFGGSLRPASPAHNPLFSQAPPAPSPAPAPAPAPAAAALPTPTPAQSSMDKTQPEHFISIRELNESLLQHLKSQDLNKDLTSIFQYYQHEVKKLQDTAAPSEKPASSGLGNSILGKAAAPQASGLFGAAASASAEPTYPALPSNASATSKLFQAALDKPAPSPSLFAPVAKTNGFTPSTNSLFAKTPTTSLFAAPSTEPPLSASTPQPASGPTGTSASNTSLNAATPSLFSAQSADTTTKPAGFVPTVTPSSGGSSFLSSFGQQAAKNAEKEKKRRRDEEYDSDEEDETSWEKRDAEEQAAKRAKIEEAAKASSGFKFVPAGTSTSGSIFGKPAEPTQSKDAPVEKHTWTQGTPIKFAGAAASTTPAAAAPKINLFGSAPPAANTPKPTSTFNFGQPSATPAPATTFSFGQPSATPAPATSTDSNTADGEEGDAAPPEPQLDDMAVLHQSEQDENDILLYIENSKSRKLEGRPAEGGAEKFTWLDKGKGPIWILRNKGTGKTRVLQKIKDSGRVSMNFSVLPGNESLYKNEGMSGKAIMATFIDHIGDKEAKKPSQWAVILGKKEDAAEFTRILREEQKKA